MSTDFRPETPEIKEDGVTYVRASDGSCWCVRNDYAGFVVPLNRQTSRRLERKWHKMLIQQEGTR